VRITPSAQWLPERDHTREAFSHSPTAAATPLLLFRFAAPVEPEHVNPHSDCMPDAVHPSRRCRLFTTRRRHGPSAPSEGARPARNGTRLENFGRRGCGLTV